MNLKRKKKRALTILFTLIVALCLVWRVIPRSFSQVISVDAAAISSITCTASTGGIAYGAPYIDYYSLPTCNAEDEHFDEIIGLLTQTAYCPDLRNLLPWPTTQVRGDGTDGASLFVVWGNAAGENCAIHFLAEDMIGVSTADQAGVTIYHPTDRDILPLLVAYIQTHGTKTA